LGCAEETGKNRRRVSGVHPLSPINSFGQILLDCELWWCLRYFEDEDEQQQPQLEYIPAPDSPTNNKSECDSDSSEDPLDAFMEGLEKEVCYQNFLQLSK